MHFAVSRILNKHPGIHHFGNQFKIDFNVPIYKDVINLLKKEPMSFTRLKDDKELKSYDADRILHALHMLVAGEYIMPVKSGVSYGTYSKDRAIKFSSKLAENIIKEDFNINSILFLPSRNTGQVAHFGPVMALFLKSYFQNIKNNHCNFVYDHLSKQGMPVQIQNVRINNLNELMPAIEKLYKIFLDKILPDLARLVIIK